MKQEATTAIYTIYYINLKQFNFTMISIGLISDLHLEYQKVAISASQIRNLDYLILAGDICSESVFKNKEYARLLKLFDNCVKKQVLYIPGNHEFENKVLNSHPTKLLNLPTIHEYISALNLGKTTCLDCDSYITENKDILFIGAPLWCSMSSINERISSFSTEDQAKIKLDLLKWADSYLPELTSNTTIVGDNSNLKRYLSVNDILDLARYQLNWFETMLEKATNDPNIKSIVSISHHAPLMQSCDPQYSTTYTNTWFANDYQSFFEKTDKLKFWLHGHIHYKSDYLFKNTRVICNPVGTLTPNERVVIKYFKL